jgi:ABC-type Fe3+-hydroxamate transport system substrate-binding protein
MVAPSAPAYHGSRRWWASRLAASALACAALAAGCQPEATRDEGAREPPPPRIVCVGAELGALLVEFGLGPGVVGADTPTLATPGLGHALDLGAPPALSAELARALRPDVVFVLPPPSSSETDFAAALEAAAIPVHVLSPRRTNEVIESIQRIGRSVGRELRAAAITARLARDVSQVATLRDGRARLRAAWVLEGDPLVVVGGTGLLHELLELAGAENAFHTPGDERLEIAPADLGARGPDVVLASAPGAPEVAGARSVAIDPSIGALPALDLPARVRSLHAVLYPASAPAP